jgi:hypothetical protein
MKHVIDYELLYKKQCPEIKELKGQKKRLENMLFKMGRMNQSPCFVCGYNGDGYYQSDKHRCAYRHHKLFDARVK